MLAFAGASDRLFVMEVGGRQMLCQSLHDMCHYAVVSSGPNGRTMRLSVMLFLPHCRAPWHQVYVRIIIVVLFVYVRMVVGGVDSIFSMSLSFASINNAV